MNEIPTTPWRPALTELSAWFRTIVSAGLYAVVIVTFVGQVARVEGHSMEPTLHDQDRLVVNKLAYQVTDPAVGDIVMLLSPEKPEMTLVKRVVAGPGDTVSMTAGRLFRNGIRVPDDQIPEDYRSFESRAVEVVPPGHYFVMGDHRNNSSDSRSWGFVPKKYILGKVQVRWWPLDRARVFEP